MLKKIAQSLKYLADSSIIEAEFLAISSMSVVAFSAVSSIFAIHSAKSLDMKSLIWLRPKLSPTGVVITAVDCGVVVVCESFTGLGSGKQFTFVNVLLNPYF